MELHQVPHQPQRRSNRPLRPHHETRATRKRHRKASNVNMMPQITSRSLHQNSVPSVSSVVKKIRIPKTTAPAPSAVANSKDAPSEPPRGLKSNVPANHLSSVASVSGMAYSAGSAPR